MTIRTPEAVRWIVRKLEDAGHDSWAVGGAVRDALLGEPSADWDLATRATPKQMRKLFRRTVPIGVEHGTVGIIAKDERMYEVTTFRRDVETDGRHAVVAFSDSIEEDLARRDFTVNAIAWHPLREELLDPWNGADDLEAGILRTVGMPSERFAEDYLRVLRALRFAGRFGLEIHVDTWDALTAVVGELPGLSAERMREEIWKILEGAADPTRSLRLYRDSGAMEVVAPEILDRHTGDETLDAALQVVSSLPRTRPLLRWVALVRAGGAAGDTASVSGLQAESERDARAAVAAVGLMSRLRFSNARTDRTSRLVAAGAGRVLPGPDASDEERRRWLARVGPDLLPDLGRLSAGSAAGELARRETADALRSLRTIASGNAPLTVGDLDFSGRDLIAAGHRPGPWFGEILDHLLDRTLEDPGLNQKARLAEIAEGWIADREAE